MTTEFNVTSMYAPVGALVYCRYWQSEYRVLAHEPNGYVTIQWTTGSSAGQISSHCTPFQHGRDAILEMPSLDHNGERTGRVGLQDHGPNAATCWCAEHLHTPTVSVTLKTHERIRNLREGTTYKVYFDGQQFGVMDANGVANRLRVAVEPGRITYHPVSAAPAGRV